MAINTTWSVSNMTRIAADGGVIQAVWNLVAQSDGEGGETATEGGKARFTYDASSSDYIAYADLKESDVLGWIWEANKKGDETAAEYKARIEAERTAKVEAQIERNATQATGVPW
tara:strand:+ start:3148 stop:3492 length:345 start_codon:yes stop_codon:yes gene_type:complete